MKELQEKFNKDLEELIPNYKFKLSETSISMLRDVYIAKETEIDEEKRNMFKNLWINNITNIKKYIFFDDDEIMYEKNTIK